MTERTADPMHNFRLLKRSAYPGRGIVAGVDESGKLFLLVYFITGKGEQSRNRIFQYDGDMLRTAPADPAKLTDPSLIIYTAMHRWGDQYIVSNGDQTMSVYHALRRGETMQHALAERDYEPDANYTPRITAVCSTRTKRAQFSIIRRAPATGKSVRDTHVLSCDPGIGRCVTTYEGDGIPLPSFKGGPYVMPLRGSPEHILESYWDALDRDNRVAIAIKQIELASGDSEITVINRYEPAIA